MRKLLCLSFVLMCAVLALQCSGEKSGDTAAPAQTESLEGFTDLFDGASLTGWRKLTEYSGDAGLWEVINGAIAGDQYPKGEGGLLVTEKLYSNFEVYAEVKTDYPIDSGIFLRVQPTVLSYQVTIDYRSDGEVGGIYSPLGGEFLMHNESVKDSVWKKDDYNTVRARIEGQPPHIQVWMNGKQVVDYQDTLFEGKERVPATGHLGIQVHPGDNWGEGNKVYFRKIAVKEL